MADDYGESHMVMPIVFSYGGIWLASMEVIGPRIRSLRKARLFTQVELAKLAGIDQSTLSDIENNLGFSADILARLCAVLKTSADYVLTGQDPDSWPFDRVPLERFTSLMTDDKSYVQGRLLSAIEECEGRARSDALAYKRSTAPTTSKASIPRRKA